MSIRWRELFNYLNIEYVDRGRNVSRGWIAIRCPWCGNNDPSQHLGINEQDGYYKCLRAADHAGRSPYHLLRSLRVEHSDLDALLADYGGQTAAPRPAPPSAPIDPSSHVTRWNSFSPAQYDLEACLYLTQRGFWQPAVTAANFNLRVGKGRYATRLWFPISYGNAIVGYTGRAMRNQTPKYFTETAENCLYLPMPEFAENPAGNPPQLLIIVEGPMDALRLADFMQRRYNIALAALCGLSLSQSKRLQLLALAKLIPQFFVVLDSAVPVTNTNKLIAELRMLPLSILKRLTLPPGVDDPGAMNGGEIELWLTETGLAAMAQ
jgi:hypothetical protein